MGDSAVIQAECYSDDYQTMLKKNCADNIEQFGYQFEKIRTLYDNFGFIYPEECNTNYRDSWFHYRKLYKKKDVESISNEKYGLEEHLLRAAKDAQINFLQQVGQLLDVWYRNDTFLECELSNEKAYQDILGCVTEENWVENVWKLSEQDEILFSNVCVYYYRTKLYSEDLKKKLQELLHGLKNLILDLRLSGVNIYRPVDNIQYFRECVSVYNDICSSLKKTGVIYLVSATGVIRKNCGK